MKKRKTTRADGWPDDMTGRVSAWVAEIEEIEASIRLMQQRAGSLRRAIATNSKPKKPLTLKQRVAMSRKLR